MDKTQLGQLKQYGAMLAIANRLHKCGLTDNAEHHKLTVELQKKYHPAASSSGCGSPACRNKNQKQILGKEVL